MAKTPTKKLDLKKELRTCYAPSARAAVEVVVPPLQYLMADGEGDPNAAPMYRDAVEALFSLSYTLKFMVKKRGLGPDYAVMPLEGLWWADDMSTFTPDDKSSWKWTLMILQPDFITAAMVTDAQTALVAKNGHAPRVAVRLDALDEGRCAQILHVGPFSEEGPSVEKVHALIDACGCRRAGKHHEIYLSDIRKAAPRTWKTVVRQPMR